MPRVPLLEIKTAIMRNISQGVSAIVIGLDLGSKYIGVSKTDYLCQSVFAIGGFRIKDPDNFHETMGQILEKHEALGIAFGIPKEDQEHSKGFRNKMDKLDAFLSEKQKRVLMVEIDETCTTMASKIIISRLEKEKRQEDILKRASMEKAQAGKEHYNQTKKVKKKERKSGIL